MKPSTKMELIAINPNTNSLSTSMKNLKKNLTILEISTSMKMISSNIEKFRKRLKTCQIGKQSFKRVTKFKKKVRTQF